MNIAKKFIGLMSATTILASLVTMPASAKSFNENVLSYETLTEAIEVDGNVVPAGAIAITMSIINNTGFNYKTIALNVDEAYDIALNEDGAPIVDSGKVLDGFVVAGSVNDNKLCVAVASGEATTKDGEMFTIYCTSTTISASSIGFVEKTTPNEVSIAESPASDIRRLYFGDVNNDLRINASDAAIVLIAIRKNGNQPILLSYLKRNPDVAADYFPNAESFVCADVLRSSDSLIYYIDNDDASEILTYSAAIGAGSTYEGGGVFGYHLFNMDNIR